VTAPAMWAVPAALGVPAKEPHALNAHSGPKKAFRWFHMMESNFGDALNKELSQCVGNATWKKEYAVETTMDTDEEGKLLVIGSVMEQALRKWDYVLGAGLESNCPVKNHWADGTPLSDKSRLLSVRGFETAKCFPNLKFDVLGDPALYMANLCPRWHALREKRHEIKHDDICVMASIKELSLKHDAMKLNYDGGFSIRVIDAEIDNKDPDAAFNAAKEMSRCKLIISSSLHGLIISDVLKIPSMLYKKVYADGTEALSMFKYDDYASGINYGDHWPEADIVHSIGDALDRLGNRTIPTERISTTAITAKAKKWTQLLDRVNEWLKTHPNDDQSKHIVHKVSASSQTLKVHKKANHAKPASATTSADTAPTNATTDVDAASANATTDADAAPASATQDVTFSSKPANATTGAAKPADATLGKDSPSPHADSESSSQTGQRWVTDADWKASAVAESEKDQGYPTRH